MTTRTRDNIIGREIYEHIKDFSNPQRIEYFKSVSAEHKELYKKYNNTIRQNKYKQDEANKEKANKKAKEGMKTLRQSRTPEEVKKHLEIRKTYDKKYEVKRKLTNDEAMTLIQREFRRKRQEKKEKKDNQEFAKSIVNNIFDNIFSHKIVNGELKQKRGRKLGQVAKK